MATGNRYTKEEKEEIMKYRETHTYQETVAKYTISQMTLARWGRENRKKPVTGDRMIGDASYENYLRVLKYLGDVKGVAIFNDNAQAVASITDNNVSEDAMGAAMIGLLAAADRSSEEISIGRLKMVITKNTDGILLMHEMGLKMIVVMLYDGKADLQKIVTQDLGFIARIRNDIDRMQKILLQEKSIYKVLIMGSADSGKETVLKLLFPDNAQIGKLPDSGVEFYIHKLEFENHPITLQVWQIEEPERFESMKNTYISGANGAILIYDLSQIKALEALDSWIKQLHTDDSALPLLFLGTTKELFENAPLKKEHIEKFLQPLKNAEHYEISLKDQKVFPAILEKITALIVQTNKP